MTNRLIKNDLLNNYSHRACKYFEKECTLKQCFRCQKYDHVSKTCRNDVKCDFCAYEHFSDECKAINDYKKCVNCEKKHSTWNIQCVVKTREKKRLNIIWNNKSIMHTKTSQEINSKSMNNLRVVDENSRWSYSSRLVHKQMMLRSKTHNINSFSWVWISTKSSINFLLCRSLSTSVITLKTRQRSHRQSFDDHSTLCKWIILKTTSIL
jgi:hypothetical protein